MQVTVFSDASFQHSLRKGGYAIWIESALGVIREAKKLPSVICDIEAGELFALARAAALIRKHWPETTGITFFTDSDPAICRIEKRNYIKGNKCHEVKRKIVNRFYSALGGGPPQGLRSKPGFISAWYQGERHRSQSHWPLKPKLKHVKAHQAVACVKTAFNDWCDEHAKLVAHEKISDFTHWYPRRTSGFVSVHAYPL